MIMAVGTFAAPGAADGLCTLTPSSDDVVASEV